MSFSQKVNPSPTVSSQYLKANLRIRWATLVMFGIILLCGAIAIAWFTGVDLISDIFARLNSLQQSPPMWVEVPMVTGHFLIAPTIALLLIVQVITRISPRPQKWSRWIVVSILLVLLGRYLSWRSLSTLNLETPLVGTLSIGLFGMELVGLLGSVIQLFLLLRVRDRRRQADQLQDAVEDGTYLPSVSVFIPTYDEPEFILRRTIIGCQAMDYPNKQVYLLDDTRRPEIRALAESLGCHYMTRPDNRHAKAGNLNHAIAHTQSELIASFDADFVPTRNFLRRTVGFFQDPEVGLVQTPQSFYNPDPIARNLGLEKVLTPEEEVFYRQIQPMRDGAGSVVCSGTSFVLRRAALEETGGFVTESLSEDYFTAVRLAAQGHKVAYLDEKLSAGLAAESISAHATQRLRWARGTLQAFFIESNPLTIPGLTLVQRLGHLEGLLHWFSSIPRIYFLLMPLAYSFLSVIPIRATTEEVLFFFLPYYLVQLTVFAWLNYRSRSALLSDIYSLVLVFPLAATVIQAMLNPFSRGFKVTPKGNTQKSFNFNWQLAWPLVLLFVLTAYSLWYNLGQCLAHGWAAEHLRGLSLGWIWSAYNLVMIGIALLILLDVPLPDINPWFELRRVARIQTVGEDERSWWGVTTQISEVGAEIALNQRGFPRPEPGQRLPITVEFADEAMRLEAEAIAIRCVDDFTAVRVNFVNVTLNQRRQLVELLFCRPGQWKRWNSPGELRSLWLLLQILLRPRVLTRDIEIKALSVTQS
ncbi:MAG: glycosyltransferase [Cyanobacteria bacterium P01_H01_bin.119]